MNFQTKWAPPVDFFKWLIHDPNTLELYWDYIEYWSEIYGKFDMEWQHEYEWPNTFYSETIDMTIHLTIPDQSYIDIVQDEYVLFVDYLKKMHEVSISDIDTTKEEVEQEIKECAEALHINLEDQQWVELVATFTS